MGGVEFEKRGLVHFCAPIGIVQHWNEKRNGPTGDIFTTRLNFLSVLFIPGDIGLFFPGDRESSEQIKVILTHICREWVSRCKQLNFDDHKVVNVCKPSRASEAGRSY